MNEQYIAEQFWPTGEAAANLRVLFLRASIAEVLGDKRAGHQAIYLWEKLTGVYTPDFEPDPATKEEQVKQQLKILFG